MTAAHVAAWPAPVGDPLVAIRYAFFSVGHASEWDVGTAEDPQRTVTEWRYWPENTPALRAADTSPFVERWTMPDWDHMPMEET